MAALKLNFTSKLQNAKIVTVHEGRVLYRHEPYGTDEPYASEGYCVIPDAPSCLATQVYWNTPYQYAPTPIPIPGPSPAVDQIPQQAFFTPYPQGGTHTVLCSSGVSEVEPAPFIHDPSCVPKVQTPPHTPDDGSLSVSVTHGGTHTTSRESTTIHTVQGPSIFEGCISKRERRAVATLVITKGLQQGKNRTYGASRRKMTKWAQLQGVSKEDLQTLVEYLNELFLGGAGFQYVAVDAVSLAEGVSEGALTHIAHLIHINEVWEGCLCYITPAQCYEMRP
eukprot:Hpha_TRINITY_DN15666_c0_g1::TRINITY_DN15666_c0_g1_i1::g.101774::m.101774